MEGGAMLPRDKTADAIRDTLSKVPRVTLMFWVIKILATTVGETGGDALSMTLNLGYAVSSLIFLGVFCYHSHRPNEGQTLPSALLLGGSCGYYYGGHYDLRLFGPYRRPW